MKTIKAQLLEATKGKKLVVITDKGIIYGHNASESVLWAGGGIRWIFNAYDIGNFLRREGYNFLFNDILYTNTGEFLNDLKSKLEEC